LKLFKLTRALVLALVISMLAVACGGTDSEADSDSPSASEGSDAETADNATWCDAYVTAQAAVVGAQSGSDPSVIPGLLDDVENSPPEEIAEVVAEFVPQVRGAVESQDPAVFESEEFQAADEELDAYVAADCGYESFSVSAVDYAFEGLPESVPAGNVTFDWTNDGGEVHEMLLVKLLDESVTVDDLMEMSDKDAQGKLQFIGAVFGPPTTEDVETYPLEAGKYLAVCFVPVGATDMEALNKADGPPHIAEGMSAEFTVE
jgi:hypothetical protein